jgi:hypothetical protein
MNVRFASGRSGVMGKPDTQYKRMFWVFTLVLGIPSMIWTGANAYNESMLRQKSRALDAKIAEVHATERALLKSLDSINAHLAKEAKTHGIK